MVMKSDTPSIYLTRKFSSATPWKLLSGSTRTIQSLRHTKVRSESLDNTLSRSSWSFDDHAINSEISLPLKRSFPLWGNGGQMKWKVWLVGWKLRARVHPNGFAPLGTLRCTGLWLRDDTWLAGWLADYSINTAHRRKYLVSRYVYSIATNYRGAGEVSGWLYVWRGVK